MLFDCKLTTFFSGVQTFFNFIFANKIKNTLSLLHHIRPKNMITKYITVLLPHAAYLFILGMLFYFWLRLTYILTFVKAISEPPHTQEYKRLRRKSRILAFFQLAMFGTWLALLLPDWISKVIMANEKYLIISSFGTGVAFIALIIAGGEAAKWLTHDEDFNEQLTKNNKP